MSAMHDFHIGIPAHQPEPAPLTGLRDTLLAICLTVLAALALHSMTQNGTITGASAPVVQDWHGNSGSLPTAR